MSTLLNRFVRLVEAQQRIREIHVHIQRQRQLIHEFERKGGDIISAQIVLDSFLLSQMLLKRDATHIRKEIESELGRPISLRL